MHITEICQPEDKTKDSTVEKSGFLIIDGNCVIHTEHFTIAGEAHNKVKPESIIIPNINITRDLFEVEQNQKVTRHQIMQDFSLQYDKLADRINDQKMELEKHTIVKNDFNEKMNFTNITFTILIFGIIIYIFIDKCRKRFESLFQRQQEAEEPIYVLQLIRFPLQT